MLCLNNKGIAIVYLAIILTALLAIAGLVIDVGHAYLVKGQLQNAADAGALAGAGELYKPSLSPPFPIFNSAVTVATSFTKLNSTDGTNLTDADIVSIQAGYWDLSENPATAHILPQSTPQTGKCSTSGSPCTSNAGCSSSEACNIQIVPAVQVTVEKSGGVATFFAKVLGFNSFNPRATAVAARGYALNSVSTFPMALTKCLFDNIGPLPSATIHISSPYTPGGSTCNSGQWTSLKLGTSNVPDIRNLLDGTISSTVTFGDSIFIQPGTETTLYQKVGAEYIGKTVIVPIVTDPSVSTADWTTITGFAAFQIEGVVATGNNKEVFGHFVEYYSDPNAGRPGGQISNLITPPTLIK
jgi:Flp pilus assembly protein TadG